MGVEKMGVDKHYFSKFDHRDPNKKQWYAIQMVSNVIEQRKLNMIDDHGFSEMFSVPKLI